MTKEREQSKYKKYNEGTKIGRKHKNKEVL